MPTTTRRILPDVHVLTSYFPLPGLGVLPVNAFVVTGSEPMLIDTGLLPETDDFMAALAGVVDPGDLRWLWLTHADPDHTGSLHRLLDELPDLRLITSFMNFGQLGLTQPVPPQRVHLLNPGESMPLGDRTVRALRPPTFDNPGTTGLFDRRSRALFTSDCFGALLPEPADAADDIDPTVLADGQTRWSTMDAPWVHNVDRGRFAAELGAVRALDPSYVLSSHLPPAEACTDRLLDTLAQVPDAPRFDAPGQAALTAMLAGLTQPA